MPPAYHRRWGISFSPLMPRHLARPAQKFIFDLLLGVLIGRCLLLTRIAAGISSKRLDFKAAYKRLQRNIQLHSLDLIFKRAQRNNLSLLTDDDIVAVDIGDVSKPYARTMEGLATVADGSKGHSLGPGFWLIGAIAVNPSSSEKSPLPIHLSLYSANEPSFVSENHVINKLCSEIADRCQVRRVRPTIVIDRGGDRPAILQNLFKLPLFAVVRLNRRHLEDAETGGTIPVPMDDATDKQIMTAKTTIVRISKTGKRVPMKIRFGAKAVHLPSKITSALLSVVVFHIEGNASPVYLITNRTTNTNKEILAIIFSYLARWSIEETYRFLKSANGLESVRTQFLNSTKQLIIAAFLAACFTWKCAVSKDMRKQLNEKSFRLKRAPESLYNWMYRAAGCVAAWLEEMLPELKLMRFLLQQPRILRKHLPANRGVT
jgi:hypothetical protein